MRTPEEFYSGHIKDATNINYYADDFIDKIKIINKGLPIYIYCRSGGRSTAAALKMQQLGFTKIFNLSKGVNSLVSADYQLIKTSSAVHKTGTRYSELTVNNFLDTNDLVLFAFITEWCVPCRKMTPIVEEIMKENPNVSVLFLDADENKKLMESYNIQAVPGFIFFKHSKEVFRHTGIISKNELLTRLI